MRSLIRWRVCVALASDSLSSTELQDRLLKASRAVRVMFAAWARMEREDPPNLPRYERVREAWGKLARDFLEPIGGEDA